MEPKLTRWGGAQPPSEQDLRRLYRQEGLSPYAWSNAPGDVYAQHVHDYHKVLYVLRGSITWILPQTGQEIETRPGDRLDLPRGTVHGARVGPQGVICLERPPGVNEGLSLKTKVLWIRDESLRQILEGRKTVEVRVAYSNLARLQPGDRLLLNDQYAYLIRRIGRYPDFAALLAAEDPAAIAPDLSPEDLLPALRSIYPPEKETLGAVALEIEPEKA